MQKRFKKELDSFKKLGFLNHLNISKEESLLLPIRYNARAVVLLDNNKIILIKAENEGYHSIVGGGIKDNESIKDALTREVKEESGYNFSMISSVGYLEYWTKKYRKFDFCFLIKATGKPSLLNLTEAELNFGHEVLEISINEALEILRNDIKDSSKVVSHRSLVELEEAQKYIDNVLK